MKTCWLCAGLLAFSASQVQAADLPSQEYAPSPVVSPGFNWSGSYAGAFLGYGIADTELSGGPGFWDDADVSESIEPDGIMGSVFIGYNFMSGNWVYGPELEIGYLGLEETDNPIGTEDDFLSAEFGLFGTLAARLGYAFDRTLIYGKAGLVLADYDGRGGDLDGGVPDLTDLASEDGVRIGAAVGGGLEYAFSDRWTARAEYQYYWLDDADGTNNDGENYTFEDQVHTFKIGVSYRFGSLF